MNVLAKYLGCISGVEAEADAMLIVNSNAPESLKLSRQLLQLISGTPQVIQTRRRIQRVQLSSDPLPKLAIDFARCFGANAVVNIRGTGVFEGENCDVGYYTLVPCTRKSPVSRDKWRARQTVRNLLTNSPFIRYSHDLMVFKIRSAQQALGSAQRPTPFRRFHSRGSEVYCPRNPGIVCGDITGD